MTKEELDKLNPSLDNPITLVNTDGYFVGRYRLIKAIGFANDFNFNIIDSQGYAAVFPIDRLRKYQQFIDEPECETLYECLTKFGEAVFLFEDGRHPNFETNEKSDRKREEALSRRLGRTLHLNMKTWKYTEYNPDTIHLETSNE